MSSGGGVASTTRVVLWFKNDLRLTDNYIVKQAEAIAARTQHCDVLPVYCFDPRTFAPSKWGSPKTGGHRARFLLECVLNLKQNLRAIGSDLLVVVGKPEDVIPQYLLEGAGATNLVLTQEETSQEEHRAERALKSAIKRTPGTNTLKTVWGSTLFHKDDVPYAADMSDLPDGFTPFRNKAESRAQVRAPLPPPSKGALPLAGPAGSSTETADTWPAKWAFEPSLDHLPFATVADNALAKRGTHPQSVLPFVGGESAGLARVRYYVWESECIATYFETRNGMLGGDYSSKLSPWLASGCVSPRHINAEVRKFEKQKVENKSTYWLIFELIWRDFYKFFAVKHGNAIFMLDGTASGGGGKGGGGGAQWRLDPPALAAWKAGKTGYPLVDANMRELTATGFMSNRGRQNVASWLALDAGLDWRLGAEWFESQLLDSDVSSNWGNWVAAAGMTGGRVNKFNIAKQTKDYDPQGKYIKAWLPELKNVPAQYIAEPRHMPRDVAEKCGCVIGVDYPVPIKMPPRQDYGGGGGRGGGYGGGRGGGRGDGGRGGGRNKGDNRSKGRNNRDVDVYG